MSKLAVNFQSIPRFGESLVRDSGMEYAFVIDPPDSPCFPTAKVIGRTYIPDAEANELVLKGAAGAEEWFNRWLPIYESRDYVHAWESPNEPHPMWDYQFRISLKEFLIKWSQLMHSRGWKTVGGSFSVGWPNIDEAKDVGAGLAACDYWSVHEYSAPTMYDEESWLCLRYRRTVQELREAGFPIRPLIITECGIDGGVLDGTPVGVARPGWKTFCDNNVDLYMQQLAWYDSELMKDEYVEAAAIFVGGPYQDWLDFEVTDALASKIANYMIETPTPQPPPVVDDKAKGIDVSKYQGDINWELVKADGYSFVIIRASGRNDELTAVVTDPKFASYYDGAGSVGLLRGAYHGVRPEFGGQAKLFVESVGDRHLELGYYADLEVRELTDEKCQTFLYYTDLRLTEKLGLDEGSKPTRVYTSPGFMSGRDTSWAEDRVLWLAHWTENESDIIIPKPWDAWEFWQHGVGDAGTVDGISTRIDLDKFVGTLAELVEKYMPENGDDEDMIEVVDLNGNVIAGGWEAAEARGARVIRASVPDGKVGWKVSRLILDTGGSMAFRLYAKDSNGAPISGVVMFQGWDSDDPAAKTLPPDAAPMLVEGVAAQPEGLPNKALVLDNQFSGPDGYLEWTWGPGEFLNPLSPAHWCWVMPGDEKWMSDVVFVPGWWDEHIKYWVVFEKVEGDEEPEEPEEPVTGDLEEVVVELRRLAVAAEYMVAHWPYK